jgi:hypothetical protein
MQALRDSPVTKIKKTVPTYGTAIYSSIRCVHFVSRDFFRKLPMNAEVSQMSGLVCIRVDYSVRILYRICNETFSVIEKIIECLLPLLARVVS